MPLNLPPFQKMWDNYPNTTNTKDVIDLIFAGKRNYNWIASNVYNTCALRLSRALNYSGDPVRKEPGLNVLRGKDDKWYAYRVREMHEYLEKRYGPPPISDNSSSPSSRRAAVTGKKGIILFCIKGWADATGHIDIWDGGTVKYSEYFADAYEVLLWT
jgi:hypothetical protein